MDTVPTVERRRTRRIAPFLVGTLTLGLTLYLAYESSELHTAERALSEHDALVSEQPQQKLFQAWKKVRYERVLGSAGPPLDEYQKLVDAARNLVDKRGAIQTDLQIAAQLNLVPRPLKQLRWLPQAEAADGGGSGGAEAPADDLCTSLPPPRPASANKTPTPVLQELAVYQLEFDCFLQALKIDPVDFGYPMWGTVFEARDKVTLLMAWLLPGVYGLLGACFYLMRRMLQAAPDRALESDRAIAAVDILLRLAAGGLAGIIVGWFWVPAAAVGPLNGVPSLSFGVAFLAGFSTDALFSMLDKLLKGLSGATEANKVPA